MNFTHLKLSVYAATHFVWLSIRHPLLIPKYIHSAIKSIHSGGVKNLKDDIFRIYLPKKYLLKTKVHIKEPSSSIFSKIQTNRPNNLPLFANKNAHRVDVNISILIIRSGAMGDVLLVTPILKLINKKYDGLCQITFATRYPEVFKNNPYVFKVISIKELRHLETTYDLILDLDACYEKNRFMHITSAYSFLAFGAYPANQFLQPELYPSDLDEQTVQSFICELGSPYIVCHNRSDRTQPFRNVPLDDWTRLISELTTITSLKIIQIGGGA